MGKVQNGKEILPKVSTPESDARMLRTRQIGGSKDPNAT